MLEFRHLNFYLLRSPLISLENTYAFLNLQELEDQESLLRSIYSKVQIQDAILLSSPELFKQIQKWLNATIPISENLLKTLYKYTVRLGTRSTPYGLFAGVNAGKVLQSANCTLMERTRKEKVRYRLDMQYFAQLVKYVSQDPSIRSLLKYNINSTLFQQGNMYKFYQQIYDLNGNLTHYLSKVHATPILNSVFSEIKGQCSYADLLLLLIKKGANDQQAKGFLDKLIENGILESELAIQITSENFYKTFLAKLALVDTQRRYLSLFERIDWNLNFGYNFLDMYTEIENLTKEVSLGISSKNLIQGDLLLGMKNNVIPERDVKLIIDQLKDLTPFSISPKNKDLENFKENFLNRYDGQMISLLQAIDPDTGIGYGRLPDYMQSNSIINDIKTVEEEKANFDKKKSEEFLIEKYIGNLDQHLLKEVVIDKSDIDNLENRNTEENIPSTFYAKGNLLYTSQDSEPTFCLHACGGTSAANLLSRFWDLDNEILRGVIEIGKSEQESFKNAIVAEIVHLPEARTGNILQRPKMRKAEIAILAKCNQNTTKLEIDDLYIFVRNNRIVLWSKELNCQVVPRLTSAHNYKTGMSIYRFLADLQIQDSHFNLRMNWGSLENRSFRPRIRYKNIILSRARWNIPKAQCQSSDPSQINSVLQKIQKEYFIPRMVLLSEGDNELLIDFSNPISRKVLFEKLCKQNVILNEYILTEFKSPVKDEIFTYGNEIILPIASNKENHDFLSPPLCAGDIQREFPLGSDWVYAKIYCGTNSADNLIKEILPNIIDRLDKALLLEKWFFIRYKDPEHHIRLRLKTKQKENFSEIVSIISGSMCELLRTHQIYNLQFDTYIREIERYTPENIELSEDIFHFDSKEVLSIISEYPDIEDRWLPAISGVDQYLKMAGYDVKEKLFIVEKMRMAFLGEFGNNKQNNKILNLKYRCKHKLIDQGLIDNIPSRIKTKTINTITNKLWKMYDDKEQVSIKKQTLVTSYIHMFINRLFDDHQRKYEYVIYHLLSNHYRSQVGKMKADKNSPLEV